MAPAEQHYENLGMNDDRVVHRASTAMISVAAAVLVGVGALLLVALHLNDSSPEVLAWVGVGWFLFTAFMLAVTARLATVVSRAGIEVRRIFGRSAHPWAEIADIQIEEVTGPSSRFQVFGAVVYDADLRRVVLPYLHHKRLGSAQLEAEVSELRRRWEAERGSDWQPRR